MPTRVLLRVSLALGAVAIVAAGSAPVADAQVMGTPFVPYYGKNHIHYNSFHWRIYTTDHFQIYFYPETQPHLEQLASYAESAYQHISSELKHDLAFKIPLITFKTASEFEQQNVSGDEMPEGVLAFSEPTRNRILLPIDEAPDELYHTLTHEMTHIFEFDIIPRGLVTSDLPLWVDEGLADYMTGYWNPIDLMTVRDAALTDNVPEMSHLESEPLVSGREPYEFGHAAFEFIEAKWGKDGLRSFLFSLRKSVIGGGASAYEEAFKIKPEDFDDQFSRYIKDRFKPFRDKELATDYGRNLAPKPDKTPYVSVVSIEPSPSGDLIAAVVGNIHDYELDIILISAKDGQVIRNLTKGFDKDMGFDYITQSGGLRGNMVPWIGWSPVGDRIAYFVRKEKNRTLIVQNVVTRRIEDRIPLDTVDGPESPAFSPDGHSVIFSATRNAVADIYRLNLDTHEVTNLTNDAFFEYAPHFSPDGKSIVYTERVSGNDKLFVMDLASGKKTQVTFGTHDDTGARYYDAHTLIFVSTASDPNVNLPPEVARNADIPNVWTLDLTTNELKQWTDAAAGNVSPVVIRQDGLSHMAFVTYYKGENGIHVLTRDKALVTAPSSDFGTPGPIIDFQPPVSHTVVPKNIHDKSAFEKFSLEQRPGVNVGVTSNGNIYGGTALTFDDVLGDKQINMLIEEVSTFRSYNFSYLNIGRRFQYETEAFVQDEFFYGQNTTAALFYDPSLAPFIDRGQAEEVISTRGALGIGIYPISRYSRVELSGGYVHENTQYNDPTLQAEAQQYQQQTYGTTLFQSGSLIPLGIAFTQETTVFRDYGPVAGSTMHFQYDVAPKITSSFLSRQTTDADVRHYIRVGANGLLAVRLRAFHSWGAAPEFMYFGGNDDLAGYDYLSFVGEKAFFGNAEVRFPIIDAMLTPLGVLGGVRGRFFFDVGGAGISGQPFTPWTSKAENYSPLLGYQQDVFGNTTPIYGSPVTVTGFRLRDARASYGIGLETFALGLPVHVDWVWRTLFNRQWEDLLFASSGGSDAFRHVQTKFWIGFDF